MKEQPQTQLTPTQPAPTQAMSVKQNYKLLIVIAAFLFLLMTGGLIYLGYQNYQLRQRLNKAQENVGSSLSPSAIQVGNNTLENETNFQKNTAKNTHDASPSSVTITRIPNWDVYTISSIGLTFQHPNNWSISTSPGSTLIVTIAPNNSSEVGFVPIQISVDSATDANGTYYFQSLSLNSVIKNNLIVGGKAASSIEGNISEQGPGSGNFIHFTFIQLDNQVLVVQLGDQNIRDIFDQILSTFEFTN